MTSIIIFLLIYWLVGVSVSVWASRAKPAEEIVRKYRKELVLQSLFPWKSDWEKNRPPTPASV